MSKAIAYLWLSVILQILKLKCLENWFRYFMSTITYFRSCVRQFYCQIDQFTLIFGIIDCANSFDVTGYLRKLVPGLLGKKLDTSSSAGLCNALKHTFLHSHLSMGSLGVNTGASCALGILKSGGDQRRKSVSRLYIANVGGVQAVLCRMGKAQLLTNCFTVGRMPSEYQRIRSVGKIVNKVSGLSWSILRKRSLHKNMIFKNKNNKND